MMNVKKCFITLFIVLLIFSCQNKKNKEIETILKGMQGKVISFPNPLKAIVMGKDTLCPQMFEKENKIVVYFDTTGCTECKMRLSEWTDLIKFTRDSVTNLALIFIAAPKGGDSKDIISALKKFSINYPFFIDSLNQFVELNEIPRDRRFHTFLINKQNKIVLVGSPIGNDKMWKLYKDYVRKKIKESDATSEVEHEYISTQKETQIEILKDSVSMGRFSFQSIKHVSFHLKNKGKYPLIIQAVNTSCGCTVAKFNKKPIERDETTTITLEYKPNGLGYFTKTADVLCNIPQGFVKLKISGEVFKN